MTQEKKKENNVLGPERIIVENNGRNFYGTFKEKKKQKRRRNISEGDIPAAYNYWFTRSQQTKF